MESIGMLELFNILVGVIIMLGMFICKSAWTEITKLRESIHQIERSVPETYVRRDDYKDDISEIKSMLHHIFQKLDDKADK